MMNLVAMAPTQQRLVADVESELGLLARYDDESIVNGTWVRQRYECCFPGYEPARLGTTRQTLLRHRCRRS